MVESQVQREREGGVAASDRGGAESNILSDGVRGKKRGKEQE